MTGDRDRGADGGGRKDILRVLLKRLPCPYRRTLEGESDGEGEKGNDDHDDDDAAAADNGEGAMKEAAEQLGRPRRFPTQRQMPNARRRRRERGRDEAVLLEEDLAYLAANTIGFVGADLQMVCSEAIMEASNRHFSRKKADLKAWRSQKRRERRGGRAWVRSPRRRRRRSRWSSSTMIRTRSSTRKTATYPTRATMSSTRRPTARRRRGGGGAAGGGGGEERGEAGSTAAEEEGRAGTKADTSDYSDSYSDGGGGGGGGYIYSDEEGQFSDVEYYTGSHFPKNYEERERAPPGPPGPAQQQGQQQAERKQPTESCLRGVACELVE